MSEIDVKIEAGFSEESAELHLSAFKTIIEASAHVIADPKRMLEAYGDYFKPVIEEAIRQGAMNEDDAWDMASQALARLFIINQRLAFMVGTELAEALGASPLDTDDMVDPIYRIKDKDMNKEEVMEELSRIMRQQGKDIN